MKIDLSHREIGRLLERKTTFELLFKISSKQSKCIDHTLETFFISKLSGIGEKIFKTITADNGSESVIYRNYPNRLTFNSVIYLLPTNEEQVEINIRSFDDSYQSISHLKM